MTARLPQVLLDIASEVEADERRLKLQIIAAARAGDCDRVVALTEGWLTKPPAEVLAEGLAIQSDPNSSPGRVHRVPHQPACADAAGQENVP